MRAEHPTRVGHGAEQLSHGLADSTVLPPHLRGGGVLRHWPGVLLLPGKGFPLDDVCLNGILTLNTDVDCVFS